MHIAAVNFDIRCESPLTLLPATPAYVAFAGDSTGSLDLIQARVTTGTMPDVGQLPELFRAGPAWALSQDGDKRWLRLGTIGPRQAASRLACWSDDGAHALAYCSPHEVMRSAQGATLRNPIAYPVDQLLLMYYLARRGGLLLHAAGVQIDGRGLLFVGVSGAGKTTISKQLIAGGCSGLLSDDRMIVRRQPVAYRIFGTPWHGDGWVAADASAPLSAIFILARGPSHSISPLAAQAALQTLLPATSIPWYERDLVAVVLDSCQNLLRSVPAYELQFEPTPSVSDFLRAFVSRQL